MESGWSFRYGSERSIAIYNCIWFACVQFVITATDWLWFQRWTAIQVYRKVVHKNQIQFHMLTLKTSHDCRPLITNTSTFLTIFRDYKRKVTFVKIALFAMVSIAMNNLFSLHLSLFNYFYRLTLWFIWIFSNFSNNGGLPLFELLQIAWMHARISQNNKLKQKSG